MVFKKGRNQKKTAIVAEESEAVRSYSDVAASRPPSPNVQRIEEVDTTPAMPGGTNFADKLEAKVERLFAEPSPQSESEVLPDDEDDSPWHTVTRRRGRSLGSLERTPINGKMPSAPVKPVKRPVVGLDNNQRATIDAAKENLTKAQRDIFSKRMKAHISANLDSDDEHSVGKGPSKDKGKGCDPKEWGNLDEEIDVEEQKAALASFAIAKKGSSTPRPAPEQPKKQKGSRLSK